MQPSELTNHTLSWKADNESTACADDAACRGEKNREKERMWARGEGVEEQHPVAGAGRRLKHTRHTVCSEASALSTVKATMPPGLNSTRRYSVPAAVRAVASCRMPVEAGRSAIAAASAAITLGE